jgi:Obg family GTPase CgtA-like protein
MVGADRAERLAAEESQQRIIIRPRAVDEKQLTVHVEQRGDDVTYRVRGAKPERWVQQTDFNNDEAVGYLSDRLAKIDLDDQLYKAGAIPGATVFIGDGDRFVFDWEPTMTSAAEMMVSPRGTDMRLDDNTRTTNVQRRQSYKERMDAKAAATPELAQENDMLRAIIMRQLRAQHRQQSAKDLMIAELQKMENASNDLVKQVEEMKNARMTLTPDEEKLFSDPVVKELLGPNGVQATLIASAGPGSDKKMAPAAPTTAETLITQANEAYMSKQFEPAANLYQEALRAEPKNVSALIGLGMARQRADQHAEAEVALQKALGPRVQTRSVENGSANLKPRDTERTARRS